MSGELPSEMIVALIFLVIAGVGMALAWVVFQRSEARSQGRARRRSRKPSISFRIVANWMARFQELRRWRG